MNQQKSLFPTKPKERKDFELKYSLVVYKRYFLFKIHSILKSRLIILSILIINVNVIDALTAAPRPDHVQLALWGDQDKGHVVDTMRKCFRASERRVLDKRAPNASLDSR